MDITRNTTNLLKYLLISKTSLYCGVDEVIANGLFDNFDQLQSFIDNESLNFVLLTKNSQKSFVYLIPVSFCPFETNDGCTDKFCSRFHTKNLCWFNINSVCRYGDNCKNSHDIKFSRDNSVVSKRSLNMLDENSFKLLLKLSKMNQIAFCKGGPKCRLDPCSAFHLCFHYFVKENCNKTNCEYGHAVSAHFEHNFKLLKERNLDDIDDTLLEPYIKDAFCGKKYKTQLKNRKDRKLSTNSDNPNGKNRSPKTPVHEPRMHNNQNSHYKSTEMLMSKLTIASIQPKIPDFWDLNAQIDNNTIVDKQSMEYKLVEQRLYDCIRNGGLMAILNVFRIENYKIWRNYVRKYNELINDNQDVNEVEAFHFLTVPIDRADEICKNNLSLMNSGSNDFISFTTDPKSNYQNHKSTNMNALFIARIMKANTNGAASNGFSGVMENGKNIFVSDNSQILLLYLVFFK